MDYSLLLGIETLKENDSDGLRKKTHLINEAIESEEVDVAELMARKHRFVSGNVVYHFATIDYLQEWNFNKKGERFMKTVILGKDGPTLSAIEPAQYAARFKRFCEQQVFNEKPQ